MIYVWTRVGGEQHFGLDRINQSNRAKIWFG